jgi:hypothetical protein
MTVDDIPLIAVAMVAATLLLLALADLFKNVEPEWRATFIEPAAAGAVVGVLTWGGGRLAGDALAMALAAVALTLAAAHLQRRGLHTEPVEGWLAGGVAGSAAAIVYAPLTDRSPALAAGAMLIGGATAGAVYAGLYERLQRYVVPASIATWFAAVAASFIPRLIVSELTEVQTLLLIALFVPAAVFAIVLAGRKAAIAELREEVALGFFPEPELRRATNPLVRLIASGGWHDRAMRRRFIRVTTELATRKRRQRIARPDLSRLYQLDVFKLRMEIQELLRMNHAMSADGIANARMQSDAS